MKLRSLLPPLLAVCTASFLAAPTTLADDKKPKPEKEKTEPKDEKPRLGMTKAQVKAKYGEPKNINTTARGEVWVYWFNRGHAFIPYNFGYKPRTGTFTFDAGGKLTDYSYSQ